MKIEIEELDNGVISINDGERSVSIVEKKSTLDFHLARNAIHNFEEMLTRHLIAQSGASKGENNEGF